MKRNSTKNIFIAFILNLFFSIFELIGGILTNSVSIMADSVHDFGDAISIFISLILEKISRKKPNNDYITFPESTGDLEKDNENFNEYIAKVKEMRDKANKERIEIRKIESERGNM